jgi:DNA-binding LytR/AlgR family response regulator
MLPANKKTGPRTIGYIPDKHRGVGAAKRESSLQPAFGRNVFKSGTRRVFVDLKDLEWVEAERDYAMLHVRGERLLIRATMSKLEEELASRAFCRIHRSIIINLDHIVEIRLHSGHRPVVITRSAKELKIGRRYYKKLLLMLEGVEILVQPESRRPAADNVSAIS